MAADIKIKVQRIENREKITIADARAAYTEHGAKFNRTRFVMVCGETFAGYLETAIAEFGRNVATGYPISSMTYDFEDGNGEWTLSVE
jgi:lipopolysaccharide export system protein LptC